MSKSRDFFVSLFVKRPARRLTYADLIARLEAGEARVRGRATRAMPSASNSDTLRHIIGIERWGQRRLRTILGDPPVNDEYDGYRPDSTTDWPALREEWATTRRETIALAEQLATTRVNDGARAHHNDMGGLTAREWLFCLTMHASREALRIR